MNAKMKITVMMMRIGYGVLVCAVFFCCSDAVPAAEPRAAYALPIEQPGMVDTDRQAALEAYISNRATRELSGAAVEQCRSLRRELLQAARQRIHTIVDDSIGVLTWAYMNGHLGSQDYMQQLIEKKMREQDLVTTAEIEAIIAKTLKSAELESEGIIERLYRNAGYVTANKTDIELQYEYASVIHTEMQRINRKLSGEISKVLVDKTFEQAAIWAVSEKTGTIAGTLSAPFITPVGGFAVGLATGIAVEEALNDLSRAIYNPVQKVSERYLCQLDAEVDDLLLGDREGIPGLFQTIREQQQLAFDRAGQNLHKQYAYGHTGDDLFSKDFNLWE